jgi:hypothetical protein
MKTTSLYELPFATDVPFASLCTKSLAAEQVNELIDAISHFYYFEFFYDSLPIWGFVGSAVSDSLSDADGDPSQFFLFKHLHFVGLYSASGQVVKINATADNARVLSLTRDTAAEDVEFSYSIEWHQTDLDPEKRMELYEDSFFANELEIHWLSIMNSGVLVLLLTAFLALIIMRVLKSDYARYSRAEEEDDDQEDYGWKLIHGDVFRFPASKSLFAAFIGVGAQLLTTSLAVLGLSLLGSYYPNNGGSMYTSLIVLYALTSCVGGYVSGRYYKQFEGDQWAWNVVLQATIFAVPFFSVVAYVNSVAWAHHATAALPYTTIIIILSIWLVVGLPLSVLGAIAGRHSAGAFDAPVRTKNFPREIPSIPWYRKWYSQMIMSGFLPFSAIYVEIFYVFSSLYGHSPYQLYGILVLVFLILITVTACITVALVYFQLSMEDHRWWWSSFMLGGSPAFFIYSYAIFFWNYRSRMYGFLQGSFYFGYMFVICYFFFIMLGTVGWYASLVFIRKIFSALKTE